MERTYGYPFIPSRQRDTWWKTRDNRIDSKKRIWFGIQNTDQANRNDMVHRKLPYHPSHGQYFCVRFRCRRRAHFDHLILPNECSQQRYGMEQLWIPGTDKCTERIHVGSQLRRPRRIRTRYRRRTRLSVCRKNKLFFRRLHDRKVHLYGRTRYQTFSDDSRYRYSERWRRITACHDR